MSSLIIYNAGIRRLFSNPAGPVARIINEKSERILSNAQANLQSKTHPRTGDLQVSLRRVPVPDQNGYRVIIGADAHHRGFPYALALETGLNPQTGAPMGFHSDFSYMVPAVRQAGFRQRSV